MIAAHPFVWIVVVTAIIDTMAALDLHHPAVTPETKTANLLEQSSPAVTNRRVPAPWTGSSLCSKPGAERAGAGSKGACAASVTPFPPPGSDRGLPEPALARGMHCSAG